MRFRVNKNFKIGDIINVCPKDRNKYPTAYDGKIRLMLITDSYISGECLSDRSGNWYIGASYNFTRNIFRFSE